MQVAEHAPSDSSDAAPNTATVGTVVRPEPGTLARGVWEAPAWAFYVAVVVVLLAALAYGARASGVFRLRLRLRRPKPRDS